MESERPFIILLAVLAAAVFLAAAHPAFAGGNEKVLYSPNGKDGASPYAGLIFDASGNLYGTTYWGGFASGCGGYGCGTVFELTPGRNGNWTKHVLYSFHDSRYDGQHPYGGLILDAAGNLYGTTIDGGTHSSGTVFQLTPGANGKWTEKVLHSFNNNGRDGYYPYSGLILDTAGNVYGTTWSGGLHGYGYGTVFQLTPGANGNWTEKVLHSFHGADGANPHSGLAWDTAGNLYGTTYYAGVHDGGVVFELTPGGNGVWIENVLRNFNGADGSFPYAGLILDAAGNLYGSTYYGGTSGSGTVFQLTPGAGGKWTQNVLNNFGDGTGDGANPQSGLVLDSAGNLYGTTDAGGPYSAGAVFQLTLGGNGKWAETPLYSFCAASNCTDGANPEATLVVDSAGNLYGTTVYGGAYGYGTVFEITP